MTLDATVAGAASDSYLTVAAADALAAADLGPEAGKWAAASTTLDQQERALKRATREIDRGWRPGAKHSTTQRLRWPRAVDIDADDAPLIPADVAEATYYQAIFVLAKATTLDRANDRQARNASQASEPNTSYTVAQDGSSIYSLRTLQAMEAYPRASRDSGGMIAIDATTELSDPYTEASLL